MAEKLKPFVVCLLEHSYQFVSIDAIDAKDAKRKFEEGDFDRSDTWDYGDFEDDTFVSVMKFQKNGKLVEVPLKGVT